MRIDAEVWDNVNLLCVVCVHISFYVNTLTCCTLTVVLHMYFIYNYIKQRQTSILTFEKLEPEKVWHYLMTRDFINLLSKRLPVVITN